MRHFNSLVITLFCTLAFWGCSGTAHAELPPSAYDQMRAAAPEVLEIEITDVQQTSHDMQSGRGLEITAQAVVRRVKRTASRIKTGQVITLHYHSFEITERGWAGPSPTPIVKKGVSYRAWLMRDGPTFSDAVRGQSFEILR